MDHRMGQKTFISSQKRKKEEKNENHFSTQFLDLFFLEKKKQKKNIIMEITDERKILILGVWFLDQILITV